MLPVPVFRLLDLETETCDSERDSDEDGAVVPAEDAVLDADVHA